MLIRYIKQLSTLHFVRNVAVVAGGNTIAQAITMVFMPLVTRIYGAEAYGTQGVFLGAAGIMSTIAALSYPSAIVLPRNDAKSKELVHLSILLGIGISLFTTLIVVCSGKSMLAYINASKIEDYLILIPLAMLLSVINVVLTQWLVRNRRFVMIAKISVITSIFLAISRVLLGIASPTAMTLIVLNLFGILISSILMYFWYSESKETVSGILAQDHKQESILNIARKYKDFPLFRMPQNLINAISLGLPIIMLSAHSGLASAGYFSLAQSMLAVPAGLIGNSVMQVFYPKVTEAIHENNNVRRLVVNATIGMCLIGIFPFLAITIAGPTIFSSIFGSEWRMSGIYAQWLSLFIFLQYLNKPAVSAIPALRLQGGLLLYEVFSTAAKIIALYLGFNVFGSDIVAIKLFAIVGSGAYLFLISWVLWNSPCYTREQ